MTEPRERRKNSRNWLAVFLMKSMESASSSWFVWSSFISADRSSPWSRGTILATFRR